MKIVTYDNMRRVEKILIGEILNLILIFNISRNDNSYLIDNSYNTRLYIIVT